MSKAGIEFLALLTAMLTLGGAVLGYLRIRGERKSEPNGIVCNIVSANRERKGEFGPSSEVTPLRRTVLATVYSLLTLIFLVLMYLIYFTDLFGMKLFQTLDTSDTESYLRYMEWLLFAELGLFWCFYVFAFLLYVTTLGTWIIDPPQAQATQAETKIIVAGSDIQSVQAHCISAINAIGAKITRVDSDNGVIKANKGRSRFSLDRLSKLVDEITLSLSTMEAASQKVEITINSTGVRPSLDDDSERHKSQINSIVDHIVGVT